MTFMPFDESRIVPIDSITDMTEEERKSWTEQGAVKGYYELATNRFTLWVEGSTGLVVRRGRSLDISTWKILS